MFHLSSYPFVYIGLIGLIETIPISESAVAASAAVSVHSRT